MEKQLIVTYYHHSGFSVASGDILLVFDYWLGEHHELPQDKQITPETLKKYSKTYVFISHEHPDHMDPVVFTWREVADVTYIVSGDMPVGTRGRRMNAGDTLTLSDRLTVQAYPSTDLGVSFLVEMDGFRVFHAGDLNFWHWRDESTVKEIEEAEEDFHAAMRPIEGQSIDLAFFPVDPRQGQMYDAGANYFIMTVKPKLLVPMHFWGRGDLAAEYARRSRNRDTEVLALTHYGEQMILERDEQGTLSVTQLVPEPPAVSKEPAMVIPVEEELPPDEIQVNLRGYDEHDPFNDTDLPVDIDKE